MRGINAVRGLRRDSTQAEQPGFDAASSERHAAFLSRQRTGQNDWGSCRGCEVCTDLDKK